MKLNVNFEESGSNSDAEGTTTADYDSDSDAMVSNNARQRGRSLSPSHRRRGSPRSSPIAIRRSNRGVSREQQIQVEMQQKKELIAKIAEIPRTFTRVETVNTLFSLPPSNVDRTSVLDQTIVKGLLGIDAYDDVSMEGKDSDPMDNSMYKGLEFKDLEIGLKVKQYCKKNKIWHVCRVRRFDILYYLVLKKENTQKAQVHYEGWGSEHDNWISVNELYLLEKKDLEMMGSNLFYGPLGIESDKMWKDIKDNYYVQMSNPKRTGIVYDTVSLTHCCSCEEPNEHPEKPDRISGILQVMDDSKLLDRVVAIQGAKAMGEDLRVVHDAEHVDRYGGVGINRKKFPSDEIEMMPCGGTGIAIDTVFNGENSSFPARVAIGSLIVLVFAIVKKILHNGFAIIRPPGHHAEHDKAMGFCFFNNVGVATRLAQQKLGIKRVLIIDWDVHHGNGTQNMFINDPSVLYISIHRHEYGKFYPGGNDGDHDVVGNGKGQGFNINIPWNNVLGAPPGDVEYVSCFHHIISPIALEFDPDLVIVSAGFDCAVGDLGGCKVTSQGFSHMTKQVMDFAEGKLALSLEGGYDIGSLSIGATSCMNVLLGNEPDPISYCNRQSKVGLATETNVPQINAIESFDKVVRVQAKYWKCMKRLLDQSEAKKASMSSLNNQSKQPPRSDHQVVNENIINSVLLSEHTSSPISHLSLTQDCTTETMMSKQYNNRGRSIIGTGNNGSLTDNSTIGGNNNDRNNNPYTKGNQSSLGLKYSVPKSYFRDGRAVMVRHSLSKPLTPLASQTSSCNADYNRISLSFSNAVTSGSSSVCNKHLPNVPSSLGTTRRMT